MDRTLPKNFLQLFNFFFFLGIFQPTFNQGIVTAELIRPGRFTNVIGVDPSPSMIECASQSRQAPGLHFRVGRAELLDWVETASVDLVLAGTAGSSVVFVFCDRL